MKWTDAQRAAIDARNDTVLVSAAAGSGKTAVLVERVTRLIRAGGDIDRMLIVTFTRAAAAEMRERIVAALEADGADAHMRKQALRVARAQISTLHIFCQHVIKEHFQAINIDPMARIGDASILKALKQRAAVEVLEAAYEAPTADERALFDRYAEEDVLDMLFRTHTFLMALADPWDWTARQGLPDQGDVRELPFYRVLLDECLLQLRGVEKLLGVCGEILEKPGAPARYEKTYQQDMATVELLLTQAENGTLTGGKITFERIASGKRAADEDERVTEEYKAQRDKLKEAAQAARDLLPIDGQKAIEDLNAAAPAIRALCALCKRLDERYFDIKQKKNLLDFNDLEHLCYRALQNEDVRISVARQYDALFVDEYQDVSGIQEAIVQAVHQMNLLFLVGDVKQSIYRFRLADPTLFLTKYNTFSADENAKHRKILLQQNFRSDRNVLLAVNQVFKGAMRASVTEIDYDDAAALYPGDNAREGAPVELHILRKSQLESGERNELTKGYLYEAQVAAQRIQALAEHETVMDKKGERTLKYRDIVILLRNASAHAALIAQVLQDAGIPVYSDADREYYQLPEIVDMLNILRVLDNPYQDIALLSVLRCPCFAFSEVDLARIRLVNRAPKTPFYSAFFALANADDPLSKRVRAVIEQLNHWRFLSEYLPTDTLIKRLMDETGIYMLAGTMEDGEARQANLRLLAEQAAGDMGASLHNFLSMVEIKRVADDSQTAKTLSDNENVVRIMTMHKSKGLEFPVVILMELARNFRSQTSDILRMDAQYGMALDFIDPDERLTHPTIGAQALLCLNQRKNRAEEARLLYVAMTRARERLILLASPRSVKSEFEEWALSGDLGAGTAGCMLDWIGQALRSGLQSTENCRTVTENGACFDIYWENADALEQRLNAPVVFIPQKETGEVPPLIAEMLSRVPLPQAPLKTSVSAIAKRFRTQEDEEQTVENKRVSRETMEDRPRFMQERGLTATERGSAVHKALGCLPYADMHGADENATINALDALRARGLLTEPERAAIRPHDILRFFQTDLGRRALASSDVRREWAFNLRADAYTLVQGVLDLCFVENGAWVLVDYKTDAYQESGELLTRYGDQMRWYARALHQLTGKPVRESVLYAIRTAEVIPVTGSVMG